MIYGLLQTIREDADAVVCYMQHKDISGIEEEDQERRVQVAALRILTFIGMAFGSLWTLSLLTYMASISLTVVLKLALAVGIYAVAHDVFIMSQNAYQEDLQQSAQLKPKLMDLFRGHESLDEEEAQQFTQGTLLQPCWMSLYVSPHSTV